MHVRHFKLYSPDCSQCARSFGRQRLLLYTRGSPDLVQEVAAESHKARVRVMRGVFMKFFHEGVLVQLAQERAHAVVLEELSAIM